MYDNIDRSKKMISEYLGFDSDYIILGLAGSSKKDTKCL